MIDDENYFIGGNNYLKWVTDNMERVKLIFRSSSDRSWRLL